MVHYALQYCLAQVCPKPLMASFNNLPGQRRGRSLRVLLFPLGMRYTMPSDKLLNQIAEQLMTPSAERDRWTHLCYVGEKADDPVAVMERAFTAMWACRDTEKA
nr:acyl-CoA dehydrogenase domain-containing protein [Salinivibrio costicola]